MSVCRRLAVLAVIVFALAPRDAHAAPILIEVDPVSATLTGQFTFDNDVAFFEFTLGAGLFTFSASTTSAATGFDPILTLLLGSYPAHDLSLFTYTGSSGEVLPAQALDFLPDTDVTLPSLTLQGNTTYTLALSQNWDVGNVFDASTGGFTQDSFPCFTFDPFADETCAAGDPNMFGFLGDAGAGFSLNLTLTPVDSAAVPEPGTLSLIAVAASVALLRRRKGTSRRF